MFCQQTTKVIKERQNYLPYGNANIKGMCINNSSPFKSETLAALFLQTNSGL